MHPERAKSEAGELKSKLENYLKRAKEAKEGKKKWGRRNWSALFSNRGIEKFPPPEKCLKFCNHKTLYLLYDTNLFWICVF